MLVEQMPVAEIVVEPRLRSIDLARVADLVDSIQRLGLRTPITIRIVPNRAGNDGIMYAEVPVLGRGFIGWRRRGL
jgi:hypothetical protein